MVGMATACLPCGRYLWRRPSGSVWRLTAGLDAAMLVLHLQLLRSGEHAHHDGQSGSLMSVGLTLIGAQLALAAVAALGWRMPFPAVER